MKADVEAEYGKEFTTFEPVSFRQQAVALNVYYVKVRVLLDTSMVFVYIGVGRGGGLSPYPPHTH